MSVFLFGTATVQTTVQSSRPIWSRRILDDEDGDADIQLSLGGPVVDAYRAYRWAAGQDPTLALVMGKDDLAKIIDDRLVGESIEYLSLEAADITKIACAVPDVTTFGQRIYQTRASVDQEAVWAAIIPYVQTYDWVVILPMSAQGFDLVARMLACVSERSGPRSYLLLSSDQLTRPLQALELARRATIVQLDEAGLASLSGVPDDPAIGIQELWEDGVQNVVVTSETGGITAFLETNWASQRSFQVRVTRNHGLAETIAGTLVAGLSCGLGGRDAVRLAAAAGAMHTSEYPRTGGWDELREFAHSTPRRPSRGTEPDTVFPSAVPSTPPSLYVSLAATLALLVAGLTSYFLVGIW